MAEDLIYQWRYYTLKDEYNKLSNRLEEEVLSSDVLLTILKTMHDIDIQLLEIDIENIHRKK